MKIFTVIFILLFTIISCKPLSNEEQVNILTANIIQSLKTNDRSKFKIYVASYEETKNWISLWADKKASKENLKHLKEDLDEEMYSDDFFNNMFYKLRQDPIMLYHDTAFWSKTKLEKVGMEKITMTNNNALKTRVAATFSFNNDEIKLLIEPYWENVNKRWYIVYSPKWMDYEKKLMDKILNR